MHRQLEARPPERRIDLERSALTRLRLPGLEQQATVEAGDLDAFRVDAFDQFVGFALAEFLGERRALLQDG